MTGPLDLWRNQIHKAQQESMVCTVNSVNGPRVLVDVEELARAMNSGFPYIIRDDGKIIMLDT